MALNKKLFKILPLIIVVGGLFAYNFMSAQWTGPGSNPPQGNTPAPINVGTSLTNLQNAQGYLLFNRFMAVNNVWSPQYCDHQGQNCFTPDEVGGGGGLVTMADFYTYMTNQNPQAFPEGTACSCQPGELLTGCSGFQNGENDTQQLSGGRNGCYSDGSTRAQCHCMGAEPRVATYSWQPNAWTRIGTTANYTRTVICVSGTGATVSDSNCSTPKPATACAGSIFSSASCPA